MPPALRPEPNRAVTVTLGWLLAGVADGRIPRPGSLTPTERLTNRLRLSLMELDQRSGLQCRQLSTPVTLRLAKGDRIGLVGRALVTLLDGPSAQSGVVPFGVGMLNASLGHTLVAVAGPLTIRVSAGRAASRLGSALCTANAP